MKRREGRRREGREREGKRGKKRDRMRIVLSEK